MKSLVRARQRAQACRTVLGATPTELLTRLIDYLRTTHGIELHPANQAFLEGGQAEVAPAEGCLFYDQALDATPQDKAWVVAHELGHLELHARLQGVCSHFDPVYGSMYVTNSAPALARYNRRAREEAEAEAFAAELLCPYQEVFQYWREQTGVDTTHLAQYFGVPLTLIRAQLAEALYWHTVGPPTTPVAHPAVPPACDARQLQAATCIGQPVLVHAGPGTGKTATLVQRVVYLLRQCGADPEQLLVLTFSNDAAEELRDRIAAQCGEDVAARLDVNTFHGFGVAFLHHHGQFLDLDHDATIVDDIGQEALLTTLLGTVPCAPIVSLRDPDVTVKALARHIAYLKDRLYTPADFAAALETWQPTSEEHDQHEAAIFLQLYRAYEAAKHARHCLDFADLIALPIRILAQHPDIRHAYRARYRWVMVDEYQDVSRAVATLLQHLTGPENPPWVVGDMRQAIYRFRGAAPENVEQFAHDFPGARVFYLDTNYRSCAEVISTANQLASLMATPEEAEPIHTAHWQCGTDTTALSTPAVTVMQAQSDHAEHAAIATHIASWLSQGIPAGDIAVLARRNIDVRNIALALGARGIQATTAGLLTPEGAAGDLAAVLTLPDQPRASLPRLAFALGRSTSSPHQINAVLQRALATLDANGGFATDGYGAQQPLVDAMRHASEHLDAARFPHGDAFTMMCTFLFDGGDYLRRLLDQATGASQALALSEIVTALCRAAGYRFLYADRTPQEARLGFAQYFRASLCANAPSLTPPAATVEAVRVMTCHASKGLEFPCVVVAGQTLTRTRNDYPWLPPALRPQQEDDRAQADALLFVGVTRAQRALVITYARSTSGAARSRTRDVPPLLDRWHTAYDVATHEAPPQPPQRQQLTIGALWGSIPPQALTARLLDQHSCGIRTYLEHFCAIRFPLYLRPLYPLFFDTMRRVMGRVVRRTHASGRPISSAEAHDLFWREWSTHEVDDHPHQALYAELGCAYVAQFAQAYTPSPRARIHLEPIAHGEDSELAVRYDLLAHYEAEDGTTVAITLRPESLQDKARDHGLLWSSLSPAQRIPFVLLKQEHVNLRPSVFSAADGVVYPYVWSTKADTLHTETERLTQQRHALAQQQFHATISAWSCDRCPVRIACPYWLGALEETPEPSP